MSRRSRLFISTLVKDWGQSTLSRVPNTTFPVVTGGTLTNDASHYYRTFTASGSLTISDAPLTCDVLIIGGGGGAAYGKSGTYLGIPGGAGQVQLLSDQVLSVATHTVTIGGGGAGAGSTLDVDGSTGGTSTFGSAGSSTGGGGGLFNTGVGGSSGNGFTGGSPNGASTGGGGGATANGANATPSTGGAGGDGTSAYSSWGETTSTGQNVSGTRWYAGGGGGTSNGAGGNGGGGASRSAGSANTGGGAGGGEFASYPALAGGSGLIIVRYLKTAVA